LLLLRPKEEQQVQAFPCRIAGPLLVLFSGKKRTKNAVPKQATFSSLDYKDILDRWFSIDRSWIKGCFRDGIRRVVWLAVQRSAKL
jgi:hypothetical protein